MLTVVASCCTGFTTPCTRACWRGPRLYDGPVTRDLLKAKVAWYKQYRGVLEGDVIHSSSRRADGQLPPAYAPGGP